MRPRARRAWSPRGARGVEYRVAHRGGLLYILTNADGATDFKIVTAPVEAPAREGWRDWLPHEAGTYILAQLLFAGHHARLERAGGLPRIVVTDLETGAAHAVSFDEEAYDLSLSPGYEFATATLRFVYSSMTTAAPHLRLRHARPHPKAAQDPGGAERARARRLRHPPADGRGPRRRAGAGLRPPSPLDTARRYRAAAALRLRRLRPRRAGPRSPPTG